MYESLELYEEASNLGVRSATENAAYVYDRLIHEGYCSNTAAIVAGTPNKAQNKNKKSSGSTVSSVQALGREDCMYYMHSMALRHWVELAGDPSDILAHTTVADALQSLPPIPTNGNSSSLTANQTAYAMWPYPNLTQVFIYCLLYIYIYIYLYNYNLFILYTFK